MDYIDYSNTLGHSVEYRSEYLKGLPYYKIVKEPQAIAQSLQWQYHGYTVVVTDGTFDIPQYRHKEYLFGVKQLVGEHGKLIVRIGSDEHIRECKNPDGRIVPLNHAQRDMAFVPYVDLITSKNEAGYYWLQTYQPNIVLASTTSGAGIVQWLDHIDEVISTYTLYNGQHTEVVIFDENMNVVPRENALQEALWYDEHKYDSDKVSGSVYKKEIVRRGIRDYLAGN